MRRPRRVATGGPYSIPRPLTRKGRTHRAGDGGQNQTIDRITCSVCGFAGVDITSVPGSNFPTVYTVEGTTYEWSEPTDAVLGQDKTVTPVPQVGASCPFCGATRFLDGRKGHGQ